MRGVFKNLFLSKLSAAACLFLIGLLCFSFVIPFISPYEQDIDGAVHFEIAGSPPSFSHWFGTDTAGRDLFTITIRAGLSSLKVAFGVVFFSVLIHVMIYREYRVFLKFCNYLHKYSLYQVLIFLFI